MGGEYYLWSHFHFTLVSRVFGFSLGQFAQRPNKYYAVVQMFF